MSFSQLRRLGGRRALARPAALLTARPALGPGLHGRIDLHQPASLAGESVAAALALDRPRGAQLGEALVEHRGADRPATLLQLAKRERAFAQLPDHAQRPAPAEQVEQRHDRPPLARAADLAARPRDAGHL